MKKIFMIVLSVAVSTTSYTQKNPADTNKYKLILPQFWNNNKNTMALIDTTLPKIWQQLTNMRICTKDCNPYYIVTMEVSQPVYLDPYMSFDERPQVNESFIQNSVANINGYYIVIPYKFSAKLSLRTKTGELVAERILVDTTEIFKRFQAASLTSNSVREPVTIEPSYTGSDPAQRETSRNNQQMQMSAARLPNKYTPERIFDPKEFKRNMRFDKKPLWLYNIIDERIKQMN